MTFTRITPVLAIALLAGCATQSIDTSPDAPPAPPPPIPAPASPLVSPDVVFDTCVPLTVHAEVVDYTVPSESVSNEIRTTHLVAEHPRTPLEMQTGLQHRVDLHPHTAMLFAFDGVHNPVLWMKDTPSPLDMVFFDADGEVFHIEMETEPNSTGFITPAEPRPIATHVLELPAGRADALGLFPGTSRIEVGPPTPCETFSDGMA